MTGTPDSQVLRARNLRSNGALQAAESCLRQAAALGNIEAIAELGLHLYLTPPPAPDAVLQEGVTHILAASQAGHAPSAHFASVIAAHEATDPDDWKEVFHHAARAAGLGFPLSQFELAFFSSDSQLIAHLLAGRKFGPETWQRVSERIDIPTLFAAPGPSRVISIAPDIAMAEGLASPSMCDWIMRRAKPALKKGHGYVVEQGRSVRRTNSEVEYGFHELDLVQMLVRRRIGVRSGFCTGAMEPPSVFHYALGEEFTAHWDFLNPSVPQLAKEIERTGQCVATALLYLNEDYDGGETEFVDLNLKVRGRKGDCLIFRNVDKHGLPDVRTQHAGRPPVRGNKWLFSQFIRDTKQANKLPG